MDDELIKNLRICSRCDFEQDCNGCTQKSDDDFCCDKLLHQAADAIEILQAAKCPYYISNRHDRGDDSLCAKAGCEVKNVRPVVLCKNCRHRDPEDRKCDCGQLERAGCEFPVDDDYFCAYGEW